MRKIFFILLILVFKHLSVFGQDYVLPLYTGAIPNSINTGASEKFKRADIITITDVQNPDISIYLPSKKFATGQAVLICPGGGYWVLAYDLEGTDHIASWTSSLKLWLKWLNK